MTPRVREIRFHPLRTRRECPPRWDARTGIPAPARPRSRASRLEDEIPHGEATPAGPLADYLARCHQLGMTEGPLGARALNPALQPLLEAFHHVLAGGEVAVHLLRRGNADLVNELSLRAGRITGEATLLGAAADDAVSATV